MCGFVALVFQASKKHLANQHFGIPLKATLVPERSLYALGPGRGIGPGTLGWSPIGPRLPSCFTVRDCQRDPEVFFGQVVLLRHLPESGLLALPPSAARQNNQEFLESVWFRGLGTPGLQKNTWPTKTLRDPFGGHFDARKMFVCAWPRPGDRPRDPRMVSDRASSALVFYSP